MCTSFIVCSVSDAAVSFFPLNDAAWHRTVPAGTKAKAVAWVLYPWHVVWQMAGVQAARGEVLEVHVLWGKATPYRVLRCSLFWSFTSFSKFMAK